MSQWWKSIRDGIQRAVFDQQREVLKVLAWAEKRVGEPHVTYIPGMYRWLTYIEISFYSKGRVSSDNALSVLYEMRDSEPGLVDFTIRREGVVGSFWAINANGRRVLEEKR